MPLTFQPVVSLLDAGGNLATSSVATVRLNLTDGPFGHGVFMDLAATSITTVNGRAVFTNVAIDLYNVDYRLVASVIVGGITVTSTTSSKFNVDYGPPSRAKISAIPPQVAGVVWDSTTVVLSVVDPGSNRLLVSLRCHWLGDPLRICLASHGF